MQSDHKSILNFYFSLHAVVNSYDRLPKNLITGNLKRKANMVMEEIIKVDKKVGNAAYQADPEIVVMLSDTFTQIVEEIFGSKEVEGIDTDSAVNFLAFVKAFKQGEIEII